jgi:hypothetical protein
MRDSAGGSACALRLLARSSIVFSASSGYLGDILDDLGHPLSSELSSTATLLKLPASTFRCVWGKGNALGLIIIPVLGFLLVCTLMVLT